MAEDEGAVFVAKVHSVSEAVAEPFAVGTFSCAHPLSVAVRLEAILPDIHKVILMDVPLMVIGPYARARRNGAIGQDCPHGNTCPAKEKVITHLALVIP